jgi:hypothetical protein
MMVSYAAFGQISRILAAAAAISSFFQAANIPYFLSRLDWRHTQARRASFCFRVALCRDDVLDIYGLLSPTAAVVLGLDADDRVVVVVRILIVAELPPVVSGERIDIERLKLRPLIGQQSLSGESSKILTAALRDGASMVMHAVILTSKLYCDILVSPMLWLWPISR